MNMTRILLAALLLCTSAAHAQTISGNTIRDGSTPLSKVVPLAANAVVGNCTGSSASPAACTPTQAKDSIGIVRRFEDYGAVGNGTADDTNALKAAAAAGVIVEGRPGATYRITSRVFGFVNGTRWRGNGARIYMPAASFNNTNLASRYCDTCVGIDLSGQTSSPFTPVRNVDLSGFVIESEVLDGRNISAVVGRNITNLTITGNEIFGFPVGAGIRLATVTGSSRVADNYIHDFYSNASWPSLPQITAIEIDNDRVTGVGGNAATSDLVIAGNRIDKIEKGAASIATYGYQTDGINAARFGTRNSILNNTISNVGEGVDVFFDDGLVSGNIVQNAYESGLKVCNSGSRNTVSNNIVRNWGIAGIFVCGNVSTAVNSDANIISDNQISGGDYLGAWSGTTTAGIYLAGDAGSAGKITNMTSTRNVITPGAGKFNYFDGSTIGGHFSSDIYVTSGTSGLVSVSNPGTTRFLNITPSSLIDATQISSGADLAFGLRNIASTAGTSVTLDLNPSSATTRKASISASNSGGNAISMSFCTSNGDVCAERMRITPAGEFLHGSSTPISINGTQFRSQFFGTTGAAGGVFARFQNTTVGPRISTLMSRATTPGAFAAVQNGDEVGNITFYADDGSDYNGRVAEISIKTNAATGTNNLPGRMELRVTSSGSDSPQTILSLTGTGVDSTIGRGVKHGRVTTGSVPASSSSLVTLTWAAAFLDANYTTTCSVLDATAATAALRVVHLETQSASAVAVRVENTSAGALTGTLNCMAMHD